MTAVKPPSTYVSGHCSVGRHDACRGAYAGVTCTCEHHTAPAAEVGIITNLPLGYRPAQRSPLAVVQHCPTCTCGGAA